MKRVFRTANLPHGSKQNLYINFSKILFLSSRCFQFIVLSEFYYFSMGHTSYVPSKKTAPQRTCLGSHRFLVGGTKIQYNFPNTLLIVSLFMEYMLYVYLSQVQHLLFAQITKINKPWSLLSRTIQIHSIDRQIRLFQNSKSNRSRMINESTMWFQKRGSISLEERVDKVTKRKIQHLASFLKVHFFIS